MKKLRLTHEELSRILSQAAIGKLNHVAWGSDAYDMYRGCGCAGGAAMMLGAGYSINWSGRAPPPRAEEVSNALDNCRIDYGGEPDSVLRTLERAGLA